LIKPFAPAASALKRMLRQADFSFPTHEHLSRMYKSIPASPILW
jgi:hypothetical protein